MLSKLLRQLSECKVPCAVTSVYTTHVTHAKVSVFLCPLDISNLEWRK